MAEVKHWKELSLHQGRQLVPGEGPEDASIMVLGEAPGENEQKKLRPFIGKAGKILSFALKKAGLSRSDCYITNAVKHQPPNNRDPYAAEMRAYAPLLHQEIETVDPDVIIGVGGVSAWALLGRKSIEDWRGYIRTTREEGCLDKPCLITYHPSSYLYGNPAWSLFISDLNKAKRFIDGEISQDRTDVMVAKGLSEVRAALEYLGSEDVCCFDIETSGFSVLDDYIACFSFTIEEGTSVVIPVVDVAEPIYRGTDLKAFKKMMRDFFLSGTKFVNWSGAFDMNFTTMLIGRENRSGFYDNWLADAMFMHALLEEDHSHVLEYVAGYHLDMEPWYDELELYKKSERPSTYAHIPGEILWPYAGGDTDATFRLFNKFLPRLKREELLDFYFDHEHNKVKLFSKMSLRGIPIDEPYVKHFIDTYDDRVESIKSRIKDIAGWDVNPNSWQQKGKLLYEQIGLPVINKTEAGNPATDKDTLKELRGKHEVVDVLIEYSEFHHNFKTYLGDGPRTVASNIDSDGRVRASWLPQETGRMGASAPNLTNIPRQGGFREMFAAPDGWEITEADFSQAELRYAAYRSGERKWIEAYESGYDAHSATAADIYGVELDEVTGEMRSLGKTVNFLIQYGGGPGKLAQKAHISEDKAREIMDKFWRTRPNFKAYVNAIHRQAFDPEVSYVTNCYGRRRHRRLPPFTRFLRYQIQRQFVNFDAQGGVADHVWDAMINIDKGFEEREMEAHFILALHDGIYALHPKEEREEVTELIEHYMGRPLPEIGEVIPIDIEISDRWKSKG